MIDIVAVIMASGFSNRMGKDKLLLKHKGKEIYKYTIDLVESIDFYKKIIVTNNKNIKEYADKLGFSVIENPNALKGQSASIILGASCCIEKPHMFFVSDMPFLTRKSVIRLIDNFDNTKIVMPVINDKTKNPVIFTKSYNYKLRNLKGDNGGKSIIDYKDVQKVRFYDGKEFIDIDTKENYERYCSF